MGSPSTCPEGSRALAERFFQHTFPNGLTLLAEHMPGMQSAAMTLMLPAGSATDPVDRLGSATVLSDLVLRGAGARDSKQLTDYLDRLGLQRSASVGVHHSRFGCAGLGNRVIEGLGAYADIVRRPHLPQVGFDAARTWRFSRSPGWRTSRGRSSLSFASGTCPLLRSAALDGDEGKPEKLTLDLAKADHAHRSHADTAILALRATRL